MRLEPFDASFKGRDIRIVGFGAPAGGGGQDTDLRKRTGDTKIESYGNDDFRMHATPSQTCNGDSGGPALATIDGKEVVIGLTSSGDADCKALFPRMNYVCSAATSPPSCAGTCQTPADCAEGPGAVSGKNFACEGGVCVYLGCKSDEDCHEAFIVGTEVCR